MTKKWAALLLAAAVCLCPIALADGFEPSSRPLIEGIDVSQYQREIHWDGVRQAGIRMAYIRSSLGFSYVDPDLQRNADGAKDAGLDFGFYHFCTASTTQEAVRQAQFFYETTRQYDYTCRLVLELSPGRALNKAQFTDLALAFLQELQRLSGHQGAVYCSASTARDHYDSRMADYPLWVADYGPQNPEGNDTWSSWAGFQFTSEGRIDGIQGRVDRDQFTRELFLDQTRPLPTGSPEPTIRPTAQPTLTPGPSATPRPTATPTATSGPTPTVTPQPTSGPAIRAYVVQRGDSLWVIAQRLGTTVEQLASLNALKNPNLIYPGMILRYR